MASKNPKGTPFPSIWQGATPFVGSTLLSILLAPYMAQAQTKVVADTSVAANAPGAKALSDSVIYVNIVKANDKGLSHNKYTTFNVGTEGIVFNNNVSSSAVNLKLSKQDLSKNGNLGGVAASTILNEVTSTNASTLAGKMEIAGTRANLIVANPNGITCDGCGVINGANAVLAASTVVVKGGAVTGFNGQATLTIGEDGLDAVDLTKSLWLYGKSIAVNGKVVAGDAENGQDINAIATTMTVPSMVSERTSLPTGAGDDINTTRLGVYATGSMYGKNIRLYTLDKGAAVQITGVVRGLDNVDIDSNGRIWVGLGKDDTYVVNGGNAGERPGLLNELLTSKGLRGKVVSAIAEESSYAGFMSFVADQDGVAVKDQQVSFKSSDTGKFHRFERFVDTDGVWKVREEIWSTDGAQKLDTNKLDYQAWKDLGKALRATALANPKDGIAAIQKEVAVTGAIFNGDKFTMTKVGNNKDLDAVMLVKLTNRDKYDVYQAIEDDLKSDGNSVYWKALELHAADVNKTSIVSKDALSIKSLFATTVKGASLSGSKSVAIDAGYINMADANVAAGGNLTLDGRQGVQLSELDQRVKLVLHNPAGYWKHDYAERKLGGRGVNLTSHTGNVVVNSDASMTLTGAQIIATKGNAAVSAHGKNLIIENGKTGLIYRVKFDGNAADVIEEVFDEDIAAGLVRAAGDVTITNNGLDYSGTQQDGRITVVSSVLNAGYVNDMSDTKVAAAGGDLNITSRSMLSFLADQENDSRDYFKSVKKDTSWGLGSKKTTVIDQYAADYDVVEAGGYAPQITRYAAQATADSINLTSNGSSLVLEGALLRSQGDTNLKAKGHVVVDAPTFTATVDKAIIKEKSGLNVGGFFKTWSFSLGSEKSSFNSEEKFVYRASNLVDAAGKVSMSAGHNAEVNGSIIAAQKGVDITGRDVLIDTALGSYEMNSVEKYKSVGLTVSFKGSVLGMVQKGQSLLSSLTTPPPSDSVLNALHKVDMGLSAASIGLKADDFLSTYLNNETSSKNSVADALGDYFGDEAFGVSVAFGVSQRKTSKHEYKITGLPSSILTYKGDLAQKDGESQVDFRARQINNTAGDINITSTGAASDGFGTMRLDGSFIKGNNVTLGSTNDMRLDSFEASRWAKSRTDMKSATVGVSAYVSATGQMGVYASAGGAYGTDTSSSVDRIHTEAKVVARNLLTLSTGDDMVMTGAQALGKTVDVNVKDDLVMTSLQDYSRFNRKSLNVNASLSIPVYGTATGTALAAGVNSSETKALHKSVVEKTAIDSGDGGFNVTVGGATTLTGAVVASSAIPEKNSFVTGSLTHKNIVNESKIDTKSEGFSISVSGDIAKGVSGMKSFKDFVSWDKIGDLIGDDLSENLPKTLLKNAVANMDLSVSDNGSSVTRAALAPGYFKVSTGDGHKGLSRVASSSAESLAKAYDLTAMSKREEYAKAVYDLAVKGLETYSALKVKNATEEIAAAFTKLSADQKKALGFASAATPSSDDLLAALGKYNGTDTKLAALATEKKNGVDAWKGSGVNSVVLKGGFKVMQAVMANKNVVSGGTGLVVAQMANAITADLDKSYDDKLGNVFQTLLKP